MTALTELTNSLDQLTDSGGGSLVTKGIGKRVTFGVVVDGTDDDDVFVGRAALVNTLMQGDHRVVKGGKVVGEIIGAMVVPWPFEHDGTRVRPNAVCASVQWTAEGWDMVQRGDVPEVPLQVM